MAHTLSLLDASIVRADILVTEAGTAAASAAHDLNADPAGALVALNGILIASIGPNAQFADAAAAQAHLDQNLDVDVYCRTASGVTTPVLVVTAGVSAPAVNGNFRLILNVQKALDADTATFALSIKTRHSISDT
jgi:hypothetical protein